MVRAATQQQVRRQLSRMGRDVQMRLRAKQQDTSRGTQWSDDTNVTITAVVDYGGDSLGYDLFGANADASLVLYVRDDVTDPYTEIIRDVEEAGDNGATRFQVDGDDFRVTTKNQYEQYGSLVLELEQVE